MPATTLLLLHAAATLFMTGLIWFVQMVQYPLFARVESADFRRYAIEHQRRTTWVVVPAMLLELGTAIALVVEAGTAPSGRLAWIGLALLIVIWLSTVLLQVPLHRRLASGFDRQTIDRLVRGNWVRTIAWTLRSALALWLLRPGVWT
jgi:hypothetical protein